MGWFARHPKASVAGGIILGLLVLGALTEADEGANDSRTVNMLPARSEGATLSPTPEAAARRPVTIVTITATVTATATATATVSAAGVVTVTAAAPIAPLLAVPKPVATVIVREAAPAPGIDNDTDPRFRTYKEAKAARYGHYREGEDPEYDWYRDADNDGVVCE